MTETPVLTIVRVAILAHDRITEVALPAELPLREILPAVRRLLPAPEDADDASVEPAIAQRLSLALIGGAPFSLDTTLDTVGVVDGDLLALQPIPAGPAALGIVEDIADAAVIFSGSRFRPWGITHIRQGARAAIVVLTLALTGLAVTHRVATGDAIGLLAVGAAAILTVIAALLLATRSQPPALELSVVALVPIAAALALAVPADSRPAQLALASAGVAAWSLIGIIVLQRAIGFFTATAVVGAGLLAAGAVAAVWQLPLLTLGCGLIVFALLVTVQAAQLSALWARFPLPMIPAPGDPVPSAPSLPVLEDLPRRVRISDAHQNGFIAGAVVLSVVGSLAITGRPESPGPWGWYVVAATAAATVLRARVWDTVACKTWLLAQPALVAVALLVVFTAGERYSAALWALAVLAVFVFFWVLVATNPKLASPESFSLPMRRLTGFLAAGVDASLIPVMAYLVGIFTWVLNR